MRFQLLSPVEGISPFLRRSYELSRAEAFRELQSRHVQDRYAVPVPARQLDVISQDRELLRHIPHSKAFCVGGAATCRFASRFPVTPPAGTATIVIPLRPLRRQPFLEGAKRAQGLVVCRGSVVRRWLGECGYTVRRRDAVRIRRWQVCRRHRLQRSAVLPQRGSTRAAATASAATTTASAAGSATTAGSASATPATPASATTTAALLRTDSAERRRVCQRGQTHQRQWLYLARPAHTVAQYVRQHRDLFD